MTECYPHFIVISQGKQAYADEFRNDKTAEITIGDMMENTGKIIRDILKFYFSYILIVLIAVPAVIYLLFYLAGEYLMQDGSSLEDVLNSSMADDISLVLGNLLIIALFLKKKYTGFSLDLSAGMRGKWGVFLWALILEISAVMPINLFVAFLDLSDYNTAVASSGVPSVAGVLGICLLAPLAEELVMRGGIEERLLQRKGNAMTAIVVSSLLFAILHMSPSLVIGAFLNGLLYGWVYYLTRSVAVCFVMHMANNVSSCLMDMLQPVDGTASNTQLAIKIMLVCFVVMVVAIISLKKKISGKGVN